MSEFSGSGSSTKAQPLSELTASRMCWPGLALVLRSSSSFGRPPTCCEIARAPCPAYLAGEVGRLAAELCSAQQVRMSVADVGDGRTAGQHRGEGSSPCQAVVHDRSPHVRR